jgi:hypothetical protein
MAVGDVTVSGEAGARRVELLASVTAANGIPSGAVGLPMATIKALLGGVTPDRLRIAARSTAGSDVMTVTLRLWGYAGAAWYSVQALNSSSATPDTPIAIAEVSADLLAYSQVVTGLAAFDRLYLEVPAIAGTATAVTGYVLTNASA